MKRLILLIALLVSVSVWGADDKRRTEASVHGHVLDKNTGEHVPFLVVSLKGTTVGTSTADSGHYFLEHLPEGDFVLQVSGVGYKTAYKEITLKDGVALEVNFYVEEDRVMLDGRRDVPKRCLPVFDRAGMERCISPTDDQRTVDRGSGE